MIETSWLARSQSALTSVRTGPRLVRVKLMYCTRPSSPRSTSSLRARTEALYSKTCPTISTRPASRRAPPAARLPPRCASSASRPGRASRPRAPPTPAGSATVTGVEIATASSSRSAKSSSTRAVVRARGWRLPASARRRSSRSQIQVTAARPPSSSERAMFGPQWPTPIRPTRINAPSAPRPRGARHPRAARRRSAATGSAGPSPRRPGSSRPVAEPAVGAELVHGEGVVQARADAGRLQGRQGRVALGEADHVEVEGRAAVAPAVSSIPRIPASARRSARRARGGPRSSASRCGSLTRSTAAWSVSRRLFSPIVSWWYFFVEP